MSRPTPKQLRDEIAWLKTKLQTAVGFHVPLTDQPSEVFANTLVKQGEQFAIVRHRPMGAQVYINGRWEPVLDIPAEAFAYDAVEAHRIADRLIAEELAEDAKWHLDYDYRTPSSTEEHLAEYAREETAA